MTNAAYSAHPALAVAADAVLPVMGFITLLLPALAWHKGRLRDPVLFWLCGAASIGVLYVIFFADHHLKLWASHGLDFSTHSAFGLSLAVTLVAFRLWLLPAVALVLAGYFWVILYLHYHIPWDIGSTAAVIVPLSLLCHLPWLLKRRATHS